MTTAQSYPDFVASLTDNKIHPDLVPPEVLGTILAYRASSASKLLNDAKKALFHGRDSELIKAMRDSHILDLSEYEDDHQTFAVLHGIIGAATETDELLDLIMDDDINPDDLIDEIGDVLFYLQRALSGVGSSLGVAIARNRAKLALRYQFGYISDPVKDKVAERQAQLQLPI